MNWKKITFILMVFLTFLCTGWLLSSVQSKEADQLLDAHGLSNNTRYFYTKNSQSIKKFLLYLEENYPKTKIQVHLDNQNDQNQVLVWANHQIASLPTQTGHYFSKDDFKGQVSFAVLGPNSEKNVIELQGNKYVFFKGQYYSVIGTFKDYHQSEQTKYYLTTGVHQATAQNPIDNYRIVIDCNSKKSLKKIAHHYHGQLKIPDFVKNHQFHQLSVIKEIIGLLVLWLLACFFNGLIAYLEYKQVSRTHLSGNLLNNWLINRSIRLILIEGILAIVAYAFLRSNSFFSKPQHLIFLLICNWLASASGYFINWIRMYRKDQDA